MEYVADTVAIIRHFAKVGKIGKTAKHILRDADNGKTTILISIISLVEILYLSERHKIPLDFDVVKSQLQHLDNYKIIDLDLDIVETAKNVQGLELHDRLKEQKLSVFWGVFNHRALEDFYFSLISQHLYSFFVVIRLERLIVLIRPSP